MEDSLPIAEAAGIEDNPYASPQVADIAARSALPIAIWAYEDKVVAHRAAEWPNSCVISGAPGVHAIEFPISTRYPFWVLIVFTATLLTSLAACLLFPPHRFGIAALLTIAANLIGPVIAIGYLAKPTHVTFYLSEETEYLRWQRITQAWIVIIIGGVLLISLFAAPGWLLLIQFSASLLLLGIGGNLLAKWQKVLRPIKTHREYTVFRGAGKPFLATLPPWPFGST
jgi:hypothetical protein